MFLLSCLLLIGCQTTTLDPADVRLGFNYFPLETGQYRLYDVEDIRYKITGEIDTVRLQMKEVVADSFLLNNTYSYVLERFSRKTSSNTWQLDSVWSVRKNARNVIVTESNVPYVKLVFPVQEGKVWNGNAYNTNGDEMYKMSNIDEQFSAGETSYENTLTVTHFDNNDIIISLDRRMEVFGRDIGLVYKETLQLEYCTEVNCIGEGIIEIGKKYRQRLVDYGKE